MITAAYIACAIFLAMMLVYVFYIPGEISIGAQKSRLAFLRERKDVLYENLRDLSFEHKAGKLSDEDYENLRASLENDAASILEELSRLERAG